MGPALVPAERVPHVDSRRPARRRGCWAGAGPAGACRGRAAGRRPETCHCRRHDRSAASGSPGTVDPSRGERAERHPRVRRRRAAQRHGRARPARPGGRDPARGEPRDRRGARPDAWRCPSPIPLMEAAERPRRAGLGGCEAARRERSRVAHRDRPRRRGSHRCRTRHRRDGNARPPLRRGPTPRDAHHSSRARVPRARRATSSPPSGRRCGSRPRRPNRATSAGSAGRVAPRISRCS